MTRRRPGYLLHVARSSAALLRAVAPNRRTFTDFVDEMQCPRCERWAKPRRYSVLCRACTSCMDEIRARTAARQRWSR